MLASPNDLIVVLVSHFPEDLDHLLCRFLARQDSPSHSLVNYRIAWSDLSTSSVLRDVFYVSSFPQESHPSVCFLANNSIAVEGVRPEVSVLISSLNS